MEEMHGMFWSAVLFNVDISQWDVSSVTNMDQMFFNAAPFNQTLCGAAWVNSKATKRRMFEGSSGSISSGLLRSLGACGTTHFSPQNKAELLTNAVDDCLRLSPEGDCSDGPHGPIGEWDVSRIIDLSYMFMGAASFDSDISKWDVSRVTAMNYMFKGNAKFNGDISKWDVSSVKHMSAMFAHAQLFNGDISKWDVSKVNDMSSMFSSATSFNGDVSKWDVSSVLTMDEMFAGAKLFNQQLCGSSWVHSKATKKAMFDDSPGSISSRLLRSLTACKTAAFLPPS